MALRDIYYSPIYLFLYGSHDPLLVSGVTTAPKYRKCPKLHAMEP